MRRIRATSERDGFDRPSAPRWIRRGVVALGALLFLVALTFSRDLLAASREYPSVLPEEATLLQQVGTGPTNSTQLYALADVCHDAGADGDPKAVVRAESYLRQLLALQTNSAPALALLGSVYTMKGRDAFWPNVQLRLVHEGNQLMDQAVRLDSNHVQVRLTRALNNTHMPDFLGRTEIARADLAWLWAKITQSPTNFTVSQRQQVALHWGRQLKRQSKSAEARTVWETGRSADEATDVAREIATELSRVP